MPLYITNYTQLSLPMTSFIEELSSQGIIVDDMKDACLSFIITNSPLSSSTKLPDSGRNTVIVNFGEPFRVADSFAIMVQQSDGHLVKPIDFNVFLDVSEYDASTWKSLPNLLPYSRKFLLSVLVAPEAKEIAPLLPSDLSRLNTSAVLSGDNIKLLNCSSSVDGSSCGDEAQIEGLMRNSTFCVLFCLKNYIRFFWMSLRAGCIPVMPFVDTPLPFQDHIDWRLASIRFHPARFPELHFVIRSLEMAEVLELRRMGRFFFERYLGDQRAVVRALLASLRERLGIPSPAEAVAKAVPLFNNSFTAPILTPINVPPLDDEYLGPLEGAVDSASYLHNFSSFSMYSYHSWNIIGQPGMSLEFLAQSVDPPTESEFYPDSNIGFRPIEPGSGVEFSKALGGNRAREQFTVVLLTYNRDAVLATSLERLHRLPYLNKVIVVWNNIAREPMGAWPRLHVPVEYV
ncbi:exostosin family protein [Ancylostoma caninum]|uniref:Exostosin family protein n=1 Tax=Ancylostoma caninum TaxID=29170 RepID=A0A368G0D4_ANCCA|nr:exostosin family protein [Ancylostoma caninum]